METLTVDGKVYKIGAMYWAAGEYLELVSYTHLGGFIMAYPDIGAGHVSASCIKVIENENGTITDAPIELEDGEMYSFEFDAMRCMGFFNKAGQTFVNFGEFLCFRSEAIMIAPLMERT